MVASSFFFFISAFLLTNMSGSRNCISGLDRSDCQADVGDVGDVDVANCESCSWFKPGYSVYVKAMVS